MNKNILIWSVIFYKTRNYFRKWCDIGFRKSQEFLFWFKRIGWNYIVASVIMYVIVPLILYGLLVWGIYKSLMNSVKIKKLIEEDK